MSKMSDFYAKVISDETLRSRMNEVLGGKDIADASDEDLKKIGEIAKEAGFDISIDEAKAYLASDAKDLSDEALDAVAGGINKGKVTCKGEDAGTHETIKGSAKV